MNDTSILKVQEKEMFQEPSKLPWKKNIYPCNGTKNMKWMKDNMLTLTKDGILVGDSCAGAMAVVKTWPMLASHRLFVECNSDEKLTSNPKPHLILVYARHKENTRHKPNLRSSLKRIDELKKNPRYIIKPLKGWWHSAALTHCMCHLNDLQFKPF